MKKFVSFVLSLSMMAILLPQTVFASGEASTVGVSAFEYALNDTVYIGLFDDSWNAVGLADGYEIRVSPRTNPGFSSATTNVAGEILVSDDDLYGFYVDVDLGLGEYFVDLYAGNSFVSSTMFEVVEVVDAGGVDANGGDAGVQQNLDEVAIFTTDKFEYEVGETVYVGLFDATGSAMLLTDDQEIRFSLRNSPGFSSATSNVAGEIETSALNASDDFGYYVNVELGVGEYFVDLYEGLSLLTSTQIEVVAAEDVDDSDEVAVNDVVLSDEVYVVGEVVYFSVEDDGTQMALPEGYYANVRLSGAAGLAATTADGSVVARQATVAIPYYYSVSGLAVGEYILDVFDGTGLLMATEDFDVVEVAAVQEVVDDNNDSADDSVESELEVEFELNEDVLLNVNQGGMVFVPQAANEELCSDVDDSFWGKVIVNQLLSEGLFPVVNENSGLSCRVGREVTRKEFTAWLMFAYFADQIDADNVDYSVIPLSDVDGSDAYDPYIAAAYEAGVIGGYPDGSFKGDNVINRAEVLKILLRASNVFMNEDGAVAALVAEHGDDSPVAYFADVDGDDQYYYGYLFFAMHYYNAEIGTHLIEGRLGAGGDKYAAMDDSILFGEAAKLLYLLRN